MRRRKIVEIQMCVFRETVPQGVAVDYQTRYGVMRLRRVRADGMGELQAEKGSMTLFAPINGLGKPSVVLEEERVVDGSEKVVSDDKVVNDNDKVVNDNEKRTDNDDKVVNDDTKTMTDSTKITNTDHINSAETTATPNALSGVGSDIGSSDDEMAEVSLVDLSL